MSKPFDVMREKFSGHQWTQRNGKTTGVEPQWHREKWPMHTAADIVQPPDPGQMPKKKKGRK